jgi:hypothetical protein
VTPLHIAAQNGHLETVRNAATKDGEWTPAGNGAQ